MILANKSFILSLLILLSVFVIIVVNFDVITVDIYVCFAVNKLKTFKNNQKPLKNHLKTFKNP